MGTALTEIQMRQLKRYTRRFVLALDPDAAGIKATMRGLEVAREALDHSSDLVFDARGLLHNEARLQADLRVSTLPDELDPDEIVLRDPQEWQKIIAEAKPIITHVLQPLISGVDINDPKTKSEIAARILPLVNDVSNPVERDAYRQQVARALQVDERALMVPTSPTRRSRRSRSREDEAPREAIARTKPTLNGQINVRAMEMNVLAYLVRNPDQLFRVNRYMQNQNLERISQGDFQLSEHQDVFALVEEAVKQDSLDPDVYLREKLAEEMAGLLEPQPKTIASEAKVDEKRELEDILRTVLLMRLNAVNTQVQEYRFLQDQPEIAVDKEDQKAFQTNLVSLIRLRGVLDKALATPLQLD